MVRLKKYYIFKINLTLLNLFNIILLAICLTFTWLVFPDMFRNMFLIFNDTKNMLLLLPLIIFYFSLHELLHALGYIVHGADPKKITFGMELEKSVFYCLCKEEVTRKNILNSLMYPLFFIGVLTYIISIIFKLPMLLLLSIMNIGGAIGDIMYFIFIVRLDKDVMFSEMDDGTSFALISKNDLSKYKPLGLDYVGIESKISRKDFKRIYISKLSYVFLIFSLILIIMALFIA